MHIHRPAGLALFLLGAAVLAGADASLDASLARHRIGTLTIKTHPGAKVSVGQLRHECWFGATLPGFMFSGKARAEDLAKFDEIFTSHFNAGVIEAAFKLHDMEREKGIVNYSVLMRCSRGRTSTASHFAATEMITDHHAVDVTLDARP